MSATPPQLDETKNVVPGQDAGQAAARAARRDMWIGVAVVAGLTALFALVNWHWLAVNVVTYGWDRLDHLITSLVYNNMSLTPQLATIYEALAYSNYYPPLVHFTAVALYKLFGVSEDVAAMSNVLYMAVLLGATWSVASRLGAEDTGSRDATSAPIRATLALVILGTVPMIYAMSRYLYLDFALTSMVAASVATLLASGRFQRRRGSLLFGVAIGLAFLVKWTTAAFLIGPLLYVVWRSGIVPEMVRHPRALLPNWRRMALALAGSAALNALWLVPARDAVAASPLGWWLFVPFTLLLAGVLYALFGVRDREERAGKQRLKPPPATDNRLKPVDAEDVQREYTTDESVTPTYEGRRLVNALSAAAIGAWIISLWYLTNVEFVQGFMHTAYGRDEGRFWAYGKYLEEVTFEQLGLFYALLFALVVVVWVLQQRGHLRRTLVKLDDTAWVLVLWAVVPYVIFSTRVSLAHSRFVMPFLPPFAIWLAAGLLQWRPRLLRRVAIGLVLAVAVAQFLLITVETFAPWRTALAVTVGETTIDPVAHGFFIQYPASDVTDPGYAIEGEVLNVVEQARQDADRETVELGLLVNSYQLHEKQFLYQIYVKYPQVRLRELARNWSDRPAYNQLFEMDFVLIGDTHSYRTNETSQEIADRILSDDQELFNLAFHPVHTWTFPNGEHLTLFARRFAPTEPGINPDDYGLLFDSLFPLLGRRDALVLTAPDQAYIVGLIVGDTHEFAVVPLPSDGGGIDRAAAALADLAQSHERIFLVRHNSDQADPAGIIESWLHEHLLAGSDIWANSLRVTPYVTGIGAGIQEPVTVAWPGAARLESARLAGSGDDAALQPGGALLTTLTWADISPEPRKASLQLLAPDGSLVAQNDQEIRPGAQQYMLLLPQALPAGDYTLAAIVYDPATGARLLLDDGGDQAAIATVAVK